MTLTCSSVKVENSIPQRQWDEFVRACPGGTIFHLSSWLKVLEGSYSFRPFMLSLENGSGDLTGILPLFLVDSRFTGRRLISLPYTNNAGPVCRPGVDVTPLLVAAVDLASRESCKYLEIRSQPGLELPNHTDVLHQHDYYGSFVLDLQPGTDRVVAQFDKRARRGIARSVKSEIVVHFGTNLDEVREFYQLNLLTRRKHGVPPQPLAFFERLWNTLRPIPAIEVILATHNGKTVAGIVVLAFREVVTYAYGASDQTYLSLSPNHALFNAAIRWSIASGYRFFDFGRTAPDNVGLMEFKRQWGPEFLALPYYHWPRRGGFVTESETGWKHRLFTATWRRLPLLATSVIGPGLYPHLA